jgi:hypothetical protein
MADLLLPAEKVGQQKAALKSCTKNVKILAIIYGYG